MSKARGSDGGHERANVNVKGTNVMAFMDPPVAASNNDFVPVLAYKANQGRLYVRDRAQSAAGDWETTETELPVQAQPQFAVDFGSLQVGWCHFVRGQAPQWAMAPHGQPKPPRPESPGNDERGKALQYRQGFRVLVAGNAIGGVRELAGNAASFITGMNELHNLYEAAPEAVAGKIPVVRFINTIPVKSGQSTNFQPVFQIVQWIDRSETLFGKRTVPPPHGGAARIAAQRGVPPVAPVAPNGASASAPSVDAMPF